MRAASIYRRVRNTSFANFKASAAISTKASIAAITGRLGNSAVSTGKVAASRLDWLLAQEESCRDFALTQLKRPFADFLIFMTFRLTGLFACKSVSEF